MTNHAPAHRPGPTPAPLDHPGHRGASRFSRGLVVAVGAVAGLLFVLAGVALAYWATTDGSNPAEAVAATLSAPTAGMQNGTATLSTVPIKWTAPTGYTPTGYTVLRCTGSSCTNFTAISNGTCSGTITGTSCTDTDTGLAPGTTYSYEVQAQLHNWVSSPGSSFAAATITATLAFTVQPSSGQNIQATGTGSFTVSVAIEDANSNVATHDNTDTVTLAIASGDNPGSGTLSCTGGLTATASSGVASFTGCAITKAGTGYELTASSATNTSLTAPANANSFNITAGTFTQYGVTVAATATAGTRVTGVKLTAEDADGNTVTSYTASSQSIAWSGPTDSPDGTAPTLPTGTVSFKFGVSTTTLNVTFTDAGPQTLTATDTSSLTGSATTTVSAGALKQYAVGVAATATAGTPVTGVTLTAEDADGNTVTSYTGSESITWSGPTDSPDGTTPTLPSSTVSFTSGVSTTALSVTFTDAGSQTLTAKNGSPTGSAAITVSVGAFTQYGVGVAGTATAGAAVTGVTLTAEDADGNTITSYTASSQSITWSGPTDSPDGTTPTLPSSTVSFTSGVSTTALSVTFTDAGSQTLTATDTSSLTGSAATTVSAATFTQYGVGVAGTATAGTRVTGVTLTAEDSYGNTVTSYTASSQSITWSGPTDSPNGTAPTLPNGTVSFSHGVSTTALNVTFTYAGPQTLTATDTSSLTGSATTTVSAAAPDSLVLANCVVAGSSQACNGTYQLGNSGTMVADVQALDKYGNTPTITSTITMSVTSGKTSEYSITSGATLTIDGTATPPNQSTTTFTVTNENTLSSTTITIKVTSSPSIPELTFTVQN